MSNIVDSHPNSAPSTLNGIPMGPNSPTHSRTNSIAKSPHPDGGAEAQEEDTLTRRHVSMEAVTQGDKDLEKHVVITSRMELPQKFKHNFWDRELTPQRTLYFKMASIGGLAVFLLQIFAIMPFYWGSLYKEYSLIPNLRTLVLNLDNSTIGTTISSALLSSAHGTHTHGTGPGNLKSWLGWEEYTLRWRMSTPGLWLSSFPPQLNAYKGQLRAQIKRGTRVLSSKLFTPGRNELATGFVVPYTTAILQRANAQLAQQFTTEFLATATIEQARAMPVNLLTQPVGYTMVNLHPYDQPLATVLTFVGIIYVAVFAFQTTMATSAFQVVIGDYLHIRSLILLRFGISFLFYFFLSWAFALLGLMFKGDFTRHFGGGGFLLYWLSLFLGMASLGLALQAMVTLLTVRFIPILFILILLTNVSVSLLPFDLLPSVYQYGKAWPAYNLNRLVRTILFGTKNDLSLNYGVLLAWIAVSCITLPLIQIWERKREVKAHLAPLNEKAATAPDERNIKFGTN
ncbi:hypothetical protein BT69DRAFT_1352087 [Atractiella rhizophila]|nr:hypothetical protein BT69DRAFT_1352087 [Atractiella rhizophila]